MTTTPAGLARFPRSMSTRYQGRCHFCGNVTNAGCDYAAQTPTGWIAVCVTCSQSVTNQANAIIRTLGTLTLSEAQQAAVNECVAGVDVNALMLGESVKGIDALSAALIAARTIVKATQPNVRPNRYAGRCHTCKGNVAEGAGRIERVNGKWITFHLDGQCVETEAPAAAPVAVPAGRYAIVRDGVIKFYVVDHGKGKWDGYVFLSVMASDEKYPVRDKAARAEIMDAIAADIPAALALFGNEIGKCCFCMHTLTRQYSREIGYGPDCADREGMHFDHAAYAASAKLADED